MNKSKIFALVVLSPAFFMAAIQKLEGQYFIWGQDPGSTSWRQIHTENFQVIFPQGVEEQGRYVADLLEYSISLVARSLDHKPRKIPVIIHNQTVVSNGFVSWAPRRLEIFTNPPQNSGSSNWLEKLVIHELRHVVQIDKLNQGLVKVLSFLLGEQATGGFFGLSLPLWFVEGDAVAVETGLTIGGRGRQPWFEQGLRAQVLEKGTYNYDKAFLGSFKDHVPNYYELGYQLVASAREQYGKDVWSKVVDRVAKKPPGLTSSFSKGIKEQTGLSIGEFYQHTMQRLDSLWSHQDSMHRFTPYEALSPSNRLFASYRNPNFINDSLIVAVKTGLKEPPSVVSIDLYGNEKKLFFPGLIDVDGFSAANGKIVWAETRTNPRWEHLSYSEIHIFCYAKGKRRRLTKNTRFFAPAISGDGKTIAVVEVNSKNESRLVLIESHTGQEMNRFALEDFSLIMTPAWHPSNQKIVVVALSESGKHLVTLDAVTGKHKIEYSAGSIDIAHPRFDQAGNILFSGAFSGINEIYLLGSIDGNVSKVTSMQFGASYPAPSPKDGGLIFSNYTSGGYQVVRTNYEKSSNLLPLSEVKDLSTKFHEVMARQEAVAIKRSQVPRYEHQIKPYSKFLSIFNLHSWAPGVVDVNNNDVKLGASLSFQNKLSTSVAVLAYEHDINENLGRFKLGFDYLGFFPVVNLEASTGLSKANYKDGEVIKDFNYRDTRLSFGLSQPLRYNKYDWFYGFTPSVRMSLTTIGKTKTSPGFFINNKYLALEYRLLAYVQQRQVARDLRPRWAQVVDLNYMHTPFGGSDMGSVLGARGITFTPGIGRHHSLRLGYAYQKQLVGKRIPNTINFSFSNVVPYPRGITGQKHKSLVSLSADYAFPLLYPDLSLPGILYLKRIHANLFADRAYATPFPTQEIPYPPTLTLRSFGIDIITQAHLFRFFFPFDLGARFYYHPETTKFGANLIFGVKI